MKPPERDATEALQVGADPPLSGSSETLPPSMDSEMMMIIILMMRISSPHLPPVSLDLPFVSSALPHRITAGLYSWVPDDESISESQRTIRTSPSGIPKYPPNESLLGPFSGPFRDRVRGPKRAPRAVQPPLPSMWIIAESSSSKHASRDPQISQVPELQKEPKKNILRMASRQLQLAPSNASFRNFYTWGANRNTFFCSPV